MSREHCQPTRARRQYTASSHAVARRFPKPATASGKRGKRKEVTQRRPLS